MPKITVLIVDDHPLMRQGIENLLEGEDDIEVIAQAHDGAAAIESFRQLRPDVTLMDIHMPVIGGVDALIAIRKAFPDARVIMLTAYPRDSQAHRSIDAGASGYLLKSVVQKELREAIRIVHSGGKYLPAQVAVDLTVTAPASVLSESEISVLRKVASGLSNKQVALALDIPEETVKSRMKSILAKLAAKDRTHAVMLAVKQGIIDLL